MDMNNIWNYDSVTNDHPKTVINDNYRFIKILDKNKIYWNELTNKEQLEILKKYYPIGESCYLLKDNKNYIIEDYELRGGMVNQ